MTRRLHPSRIKLKRVYEPASPGDGVRVLVDGLWPRGLRKADAAIAHWHKDSAPSAALRKWFGHKAERWEEFRQRYKAELATGADTLDSLRDFAEAGVVTLLFAARDEAHNNAVVLREFLLGSPPRRSPPAKAAKPAKRARRKQ